MYGHTIRSKLPMIEDIETAPQNTDFRDRDQALKEKGKETEDNRRRAQRSSIDSGDTVLMQNLLPGNKLSTTFNPKQYVVVSRSGPRVTVEDPQNGKSYDRNVAHLKKIVEPELSSNEASDELCSQDQLQLQESSEEDFLGFDLEAEARPPEPIGPSRQRRHTKQPARFNDYLM